MMRPSVFASSTTTRRTSFSKPSSCGFQPKTACALFGRPLAFVPNKTLPWGSSLSASSLSTLSKTRVGMRFRSHATSATRWESSPKDW